MRLRRFNPDTRLQRLRRQLAADPGDVELQQATIRESVRAGELPDEAVDRLIPRRPVQPWQWAPASYLLLEAERIGRETDWEQGKVEIEWTKRQVPAWGLDAARLLEESDEALREVKLDMTEAFGERSYQARDYTRVYVGAREVKTRVARVIGGAHPRLLDRPVYFTKQIDYSRKREHLMEGFHPAAHVPGLDHATAFAVKQEQMVARPPPVHYGNEPFHVYYAGEEGVDGFCGRSAPPETYTGSYSDVYDPQMLLYASRRIVLIGPLRRRALRRHGPILDVRLIERVRPLQRRGRRWV